VEAFSQAYTRHFTAAGGAPERLADQAGLVASVLNALVGIPSKHFEASEEAVLPSSRNVRWAGVGTASTNGVLQAVAVDGTRFRRLEACAQHYGIDAARGGTVAQAFALTVSEFLQSYRACLVVVPHAIRARRKDHTAAWGGETLLTLAGGEPPASLLEVYLHTRGLSSQLSFIAELIDVDGDPTGTPTAQAQLESSLLPYMDI